MAATDWDKLALGEGCAFDAPRAAHTADWDEVAKLSASTLYLPQNQMYRGHGILVFDPRHATRLDQLTSSEWAAYAADLHRVVTAIIRVCRPDHVNVESLGNVMPHLHWHVTPRYKDDGRWGAPIWAADLKQQPQRRLAADDRAALIRELGDALR
jgi:diadenosine tetraphosphate (Ap4A) HIT family hydrolase